MARVKIKSPSPKDPGRLSLLLQILSINSIYATNIITINDGFAVVTQDEAEMDKMFDGTTNKELENQDFTPLIPPEFKANRSILIFRLDDHIYNNTEDDILKELIEQNKWITGTTYVTKFTKGRGLKITFQDSATAKKAKEKGLLMFSMRIPPDNITQDKYLNVSTCLRCYALDSHFTSKCPKDRNYKICSECSMKGHSWRECDKEIKKCINCQGAHSTMAMKCEVRKSIINKKRKEERERPSTYAEAASTPFPNASSIYHQMTGTKVPSSDTHTKIIQCMYHAHMYNMVNPGTYSNVVNGMFKANQLPTINIPDEFAPPSDLIIAKLFGSTETQQQQQQADPHAHQQQAESREQQQHQQQHQQQRQQQQKHQQQEKHQHQQQSQPQKQEQERESEASRRTESTQPLQATPSSSSVDPEKAKPKQTKISGHDIGLSIYTPRTLGYPENPLKKHSLLEGIRNKTIKYTYDDANLSENVLMEKFVFGLVDTTECLFIVDVDRFRKIKNGLRDIFKPSRPGKLPRKDSI